MKETDRRLYLISGILFLVTGLIDSRSLDFTNIRAGDALSSFLFFLTAVLCFYYYFKMRKEKNG